MIFRRAGRAIAGAVCLAAISACAAPPPQTVSSGPDAARGMALFRAHCETCHGDAGQGDRGPSLRGLGYEHADTVAFIKKPTGAMDRLYPDPLSDRDVEDVAAYVLSLPAAPVD